MSGAPAAGCLVRLRPYVPRLVVDWLRSDPEDLYQEVEGSLAFVDISGFTTLTERLARRGKVGAEEMSDALNSTFSALLAEAYEDGAGLVKWGGDAVLLLFDGPDHARRACRAAHRMRARCARWAVSPHQRGSRDPAHVGGHPLRHVPLLPGRATPRTTVS